MVDYRRLGINRIEKLDRPVTVGMSGIHHIDGTFIASGGPIMRGARFKTQPSIADITPTILALMGLPVGRDMAGRVLEEIINPEFLVLHHEQADFALYTLCLAVRAKAIYRFNLHWYAI